MSAADTAEAVFYRACAAADAAHAAHGAALREVYEAARAEGEAAGRAAERERVLALVRVAYTAAREAERRCEVLDPSAASGALDVLEQRIERGEHVGAAGTAP